VEVYNYHYITKEYTGSEEAYLDPAYKRPLLAANQTFIKPEQPKEGYVITFKDKNWVEVVDHRGDVYHKETKQLESWRSVGELPPNLTKKIPQEFDNWDEEKNNWTGHEDHLKQQFEYESSYGFKRAKSYPSILDQLDALYWDKINETNNWVESITKIKQRYPKPENKNEKI